MACRLPTCIGRTLKQCIPLCTSDLRISVQVSFVSFFLKFRLLVKACRLRHQEATFQETDSSSPSAKLLKHQKNHARTERAIHSIYAGLLVASAECLPLGALQRTPFGYICVL